ncbi:LysR family transcriptional regulator [Agrobacterium tumefaciens]|uniref:LysR family transcriptional regulator n=1 Tax=Agrobacterium TaxID=357 RepID=UPI0005EE7E9F|nr:MULTISPECIES: LysR family transcriptional regulator [Agrobacterium]NTE48113.1 LysR family transcriptional regulator [Agrobacterium pusense]
MDNKISWDDQRYFLAVLEAGSFSGAARRLAVSHPTVRSRIEALERALGTVLFIRSTNGLIATEMANRLGGPVKEMEDASRCFLREAAAGDSVSGLVRISVPEIMGIELIPQMLARMRAEYPQIRIEVVLSDFTADLLTKEVDLAIRTVTPIQNVLVARKVASIPLGLFASSDYVRRRGTPDNLQDLLHHDLVGPDRNRNDWAIAASLGLSSSLSNFVVKTDSHPAQAAAVRKGVGIGVLQTSFGDADPALVRLLPDLDVHNITVWVVTHESLAKVPRIRAVFDHFVQEFLMLRRPKSTPVAPSSVDREVTLT